MREVMASILEENSTAILNGGGFSLDEKVKLEELNVEIEPLTTLMKEVLGDEVEKVMRVNTQVR